MAGSELPTSYGAGPRRTVRIERAEALRLLASAPFGRIVFTHDALPAVRPVNHLIGERGVVIICTRPFSGLMPSVFARSVIVGYQADQIDPVRRTGWSVLVTGPAQVIPAGELTAEYTRRLGPWGDSAEGVVIGIEPTLVSGMRLVAEAAV